MESLVLKMSRSGDPIIAHRQHDLSGCDYASVVPVAMHVAQALDRRGVVIWAIDAVRNSGRPGVVLIDDNDQARVDVRADVADPTTSMSCGVIDIDVAKRCVPRGEVVSLNWIIPPRVAA